MFRAVIISHMLILRLVLALLLAGLWFSLLFFNAFDGAVAQHKGAFDYANTFVAALVSFCFGSYLAYDAYRVTQRISNSRRKEVLRSIVDAHINYMRAALDGDPQRRAHVKLTTGEEFSLVLTHLLPFPLLNAVDSGLFKATECNAMYQLASRIEWYNSLVAHYFSFVSSTKSTYQMYSDPELKTLGINLETARIHILGICHYVLQLLNLPLTFRPFLVPGAPKTFFLNPP